MRQERQVKSVILETIKKQKMLSAGILTAVIGAVVAALIPPLILAKIIDTVTAGNEAAFSVILLYFVLLALTGILEAAREGLLTVFGQKITHALRSSLMDKFVSLTADSVNKQEPGTWCHGLSGMLTRWKICLPPGLSVCLRMYVRLSVSLS